MAAFPTVGRVVLVAVALVIAGCVTPVEKAEAPVLTKASIQERPLSKLPSGDVRGFPVTEVVWVHDSGSDVLPVFLAGTPGRRSRGLTGVSSLGEVAGMVFKWPETSVGSFWMKDTLIPLEIAFIDAEGVVFAVFEMEPCLEEPCPTYKPGGPYHLAFEWRAGTLAVSVGDVIHLEDTSR